MLDMAREKIKREIKDNKYPYVEVVGEFILQQLEDNPEIASKVLQEDKSILQSLEAMRKAAEKKKVGDMAVLTDQEGFKIVANYYGFDCKKDISSISPVKEAKQEIVKEKKEEIDFKVNLDDYLDF